MTDRYTNLNDAFEDFKQRAVPKNASEGQVRDSKNIFYAGAATLLAITASIKSDADSFEIIENIHSEIANHFANVKQKSEVS